MIILGVNCGNKMWMTKLLITTTTATQDKMKKNGQIKQSMHRKTQKQAKKEKNKCVYMRDFWCWCFAYHFFSLLFLLQSSKRNKVKRLSK